MRINLDRAPFHDTIAWFKTTETSPYKYFIIIPENNYDRRDYKWFISRNILNSDIFNLMIYRRIQKNKNIKRWTKKEYGSLDFETYYEAREEVLEYLMKCFTPFFKMKQKKFEKLTGVKIFKELQLEKLYPAELLI